MSSPVAGPGDQSRVAARDPALAGGWIRATYSPRLENGEVHVWRVPLDVSETSLRVLMEMLSSGERKKARGYFLEPDRDRFIVLRARLKTILGTYMGIDPREVNLQYGDHGKPMIVAGDGVPPLQFNVSHSQGLGLIAVARDHRVGIDLEAVQRQTDWATIAARFFTARECESILSLPASEREEAYVALWTRKEACLKAAGVGLAGLEVLEISMLTGQDHVLLRAPAELQPLWRWTIVDLCPAKGYHGCLVTECQAFLLKQWAWPGLGPHG